MVCCRFQLWLIYFGTKELVHQGVRVSLKALQLDYIDLYLIHWPVGFQVGPVMKSMLHWIISHIIILYYICISYYIVSRTWTNADVSLTEIIPQLVNANGAHDGLDGLDGNGLASQKPTWAPRGQSTWIQVLAQYSGPRQWVCLIKSRALPMCGKPMDIHKPFDRLTNVIPTFYQYVAKQWLYMGNFMSRPM